MKTIAISEATFETEVLQSDRPTLLDLWAPWCGPCQMIAPVIEEIAVEQAGRFKIAKLNTDEHPRFAQSLGVRSIPTLLFFRDGIVCDQLVGTAAKKTILAKLEVLDKMQPVA